MRRIPLVFLTFSAIACARIPAADSRNTEIPNTDTHFVPAKYTTLAGIIQPHGHWNYGRLENSDTASPVVLASNLARQGFVVFTCDMVGYNDTLQTPHDFGDKPIQQLWSFSSLRLQLWDSIRAIDFLQQLPGVDPNRIDQFGRSLFTWLRNCSDENGF